MKVIKHLVIAVVFVLILSMNIQASESGKISVDKTTKGDWVGNYGKDGYFLFADSAEDCVDKLPEYVTGFTYTTIFEDEVSYHQWWEGDASDTSGIGEANTIDDSIWMDETKTTRYIPAIYNGDGLTITVDVGSTETNVSIYSCDWGNDGRCVDIKLYGSDGSVIDTYSLTEFEHGAYVTAAVTGKAVFEYTYTDAVNLGSASNAVISAVFFDKAEEQPATDAVSDTTEPSAPVESAPKTADTLCVLLIGVAGSFGAAIIAVKRKCKKV